VARRVWVSSRSWCGWRPGCWAARARARQEAHLHAELARIATAQVVLLTELEQLGADTSHATQAYRARICCRHAELHDEHTRTRAQLDGLASAATPDQDPGLPDELPYLAGQLDHAPADLAEALVSALWNSPTCR